MDLREFIAQLVEDNEIDAIARNTIAQFGLGPRQYLGATLLPERITRRNMYRESAIRYRTVIANDGGRYSPSQKKSTGEMVGSFSVELGNSDIARELTGEDYDALIELLDVDATMDAAGTVIGWTDASLNVALLELNEKQRWQAMVAAQVDRVGDGGYAETVTYPNPAGHRVAAGSQWSDNANDPWPDITAQAKLLKDLGYTVNRVITSHNVMTILLNNENIARRAFRMAVVPTADSAVNLEFLYTVNRAQLDALAANDGLPAFETYDLRYWTQNSHERFMPDDVVVMVASTGRDEQVVSTLDVEDIRYVPDTLGYTAVGRAVGQRNPGRVIHIRNIDNTKPPRLEGEAWQTSLPVITEPEAITVINSIT